MALAIEEDEDENVQINLMMKKFNVLTELILDMEPKRFGFDIRVRRSKEMPIFSLDKFINY